MVPDSFPDMTAAVRAPMAETSVSVSAAVSASAFRAAMSRVGGAVHVVTTDGPAGRFGITCTAVTSVTDTPPTLLVCMSRTSRARAAVLDNGVLCVNTLPASAQRLADAFAGRLDLTMPDRFALDTWALDPEAPRSRADHLPSPRLMAARAAFHCRLTQVVPMGSHDVLFGAIEATVTGAEGPALLYLDRAYQVL